MQILGTGLTGLVGTRLVEQLPDFTFTSISRKNGADIIDIETLDPHFQNFQGEWVLHMAAKADVDGCEEDKDAGEAGEAWQINVLGTKNIALLCKKYHKKMIYISTDFVFDGERDEGDSYTEEDMPNPVNWYGETKFQGEQAVKNAGIEHLIVRVAYPYGNSNASKKDFVRIIADRLQEGLPIKGITDHIFVPTYIDDIAAALQSLITQNQSGLFHVVGSTALTPYQASCKIAQALDKDTDDIGKTTRAEYFKDRAKRPFNLYLKNDKIRNLGIVPKTFEEGLKQMTL